MKKTFLISGILLFLSGCVQVVDDVNLYEQYNQKIAELNADSIIVSLFKFEDKKGIDAFFKNTKSEYSENEFLKKIKNETSIVFYEMNTFRIDGMLNAITLDPDVKVSRASFYESMPYLANDNEFEDEKIQYIKDGIIFDVSRIDDNNFNFNYKYMHLESLEKFQVGENFNETITMPVVIEQQNSTVFGLSKSSYKIKRINEEYAIAISYLNK